MANIENRPGNKDSGIEKYHTPRGEVIVSFTHGQDGTPVTATALRDNGTKNPDVISGTGKTETDARRVLGFALGAPIGARVDRATTAPPAGMDITLDDYMVD